MIKSKRAKKYTFAVICALEIVISFSAIGYMTFGEFSLTFANIPVLLAAMLLGPWESTSLGLIFGLTSIWKASSFYCSGIDVLFSPIQSGSPINSVILAVGTRVAFGFLAGLLYKALDVRMKDKSRIITVFASTTVLIFNLSFLGVVQVLFGDTNLFTESILATLVNFAINLTVAIIVLMIVKKWIESDRVQTLFTSIEEDTSFDLLNKKMKFYITSILVVIVVVTCTLLCIEFYQKTKGFFDSGSINQFYYVMTSIQFYLSVIMSVFVMAIAVRYYAFFALYESQRNMTMINMIPGGVICMDVEGDKILSRFVSDGIKELLGIDRDAPIETENKNPLNYCHPEDVVKILEKMRNFDVNDPEFEITYRVNNRKKGYIWVTLRAYMGQKIGNKLRIYGVVLDVDDQVRRNKELEQRYMDGQLANDVVASDSVCSFHINVTKNTCSFESSTLSDEDMAWCMDIVVLDELVKKTSERNTNMDSMLSFQRLFNREALLKSYEHGKTSIKFEHNFMFSDTQTAWIETRIVLMTNPNNNDIEGYLYARDIDEQKNTKIITRRILSGEFEYVELINIEDDSLKMYISRPYEDGGFEPDRLTYTQMLENHLVKIVNDVSETEVKDRMMISTVVRELDNKPIYSCAFTVNTDAGDRRKMFQFQYLNKYRKRIIFTQSDITDVYIEDQRKADVLRNALKTAEEASAAKADFFSRVSHDLRTPLNAVIGLSTIALEENDVSKLKEYLSKISVSGEYLLGLTNDILDMAKIDNDKVKIVLAPCSISECLQDLFTILQPQLKSKEIEFIYTPGSFVDTPLIIDRDRVRQIIVNLLSNAVKFTPTGGKIWLTIEQKSTKNKCIQTKITIKDTGIGMSKEFCKELFEPFAQENREGIKNDSGTGLGLAIVKKLVDLMEGTISVSSELNEGTEFVVEFNFKESFREYAPEKKEQIENYDLDGRRILLVEDNIINTEIAVIMLEKIGGKIASLDNGLKAVLEIQDNPNASRYSAILMDIQMPVLDGLKATKAIRSLDSEFAKNIPIIAMTANAFDSDVQKSIEAGMNGHISKPVKPENLYSTLFEQINKYEAKFGRVKDTIEEE